MSDRDELELNNLVEPPADTLSRRVALRRLGIGGLVAAAAAGGVTLATEAQAVVSTVTTTTVPSIVQTWVNAWNSSDPAANVAALYTTTGVYEDVPTNTRSNPGQVQAFLRPFVNGLSGIHFAMSDAFGTADWAAVEYVFSAVNQGAFAGLRGKSFSVRVATIFQLQGGTISRSSDYYNLGTITAQLAPPPARPATPVASPVVVPTRPAPPPPTAAPTRAPTAPPTAPPTVPPASPTA